VIFCVLIPPSNGFPLGQRGIAVALNGTVVPRTDWSMTPLNPGDSVEIVRARQGG
jgi:sulfur carrier protein